MEFISIELTTDEFETWSALSNEARAALQMEFVRAIHVRSQMPHRPGSAMRIAVVSATPLPPPFNRAFVERPLGTYRQVTGLICDKGELFIHCAD